jgi:phosphate transport system ATP-binding protein
MKKLLLEVRGVTVQRGGKNLLENINFSMHTHETLSIIGAKGAGKGFLLKTLMGIQLGQVAGQIKLYSESKMGLVSADYGCAEDLSIFENLALPLKLMGVHSRAFLGEEVEEALRDVELWYEVKSHLHEPVRKLDSFQKIRLDLARTMLFKPALLLLDKPTQTVDPIKKAVYESIIENLKNRMSIIWVTHDLEQAARVSDKILFLKEGKILEYGSCEDVFTMPANPETENFISRRARA